MHSFTRLWAALCDCEGHWSPWNAGQPRSCGGAATARTYRIAYHATSGGKACDMEDGKVERGAWTLACP